MLKRRKRILLAVLTFLFLSITIPFAGYSEAATNVIRNGNFDNGLNQWVLNPALTATESWPLQGDAFKVNLHPPSGSYMGTVISQTLNVSDIGGRTFVLSMKLTKYYYPVGNTVAVYLTYTDSVAGPQRVLISNPANAAITTDMPVTGIYTFRSTAQTLTKIEFAKINYGEFLVDDIALSYDATDAKQIPLPATATGGVNLTLTAQGHPPMGFGFASGQVASAVSAAGDFVITGYGGDAPPYSAYGWLMSNATMQDLGAKTISAVTEIPSTGYEAPSSINLVEGHAYAFRLAGGSYGVLAVKSVTLNLLAITMTFDYKYLPGPTISFTGWVKTMPNLPSIDGMEAVAGATVTAFSPGTTPTPIATAIPDSSTGVFSVMGIPSSTDFYLMVQPPAPPPTAYMPVLSKFMNWTDNIQALLPFALLTQVQYVSFNNGTGNGMILGRVSLKDTPTTFLSGAAIEAREWTAGNPPVLGATYPVTYTGGGSATAADGFYAMKSIPAGKSVQLVASLSGYAFEFNGAIVPVMSGAVSEESFFGTATASCTYAVDPISASIPAAGLATPGTVNITTETGCAWTAVSNNGAWLHVSSPGGGTGTGSFSYTVDVNDGAVRTGTVTVGGQTFTVNQAAGTPPVTNLLQNGSFSGNLNGWIVNPALQTGTPPWTPFLQDGSGVTLHPLTSDFNGTILYQNLNLTGVEGKTFNLSMKLTKVSALSGQTVAVYLTYVDGGILVRSKILTSPANDGISTATPVLGSFNVPGTATKLVKLEIVKENYGEFHADDIVLSAAGVTAGLPPVVTSLSTPTGAYGASLTITGSNFGTTQGTVTIGGSLVNVAAWSDTAITVTVASPAHSGPVLVIAGGVESNIDKTFQVTSPYFAVDVLNSSAKVIKGQMAEFILKSSFFNNFTTTAGIGLQLQGGDASALSGKYTFTPVPIKGTGGAVLKIDTAALSAGTYTANIQTNDGGTIAFAGKITLQVVTVSDIAFYEWVYDPVSFTYSKTYLTAAVAVTKQGQITFYMMNSEVTVSDGTVMTGIPLTLSGIASNFISAYKNSFGSFDFYAEGESGSTSVTFVAPDGFTKQIQFSINIPATPQVTSIGLSPSTVTNAYTGTIAFSAQGTQAIGYGSSGFLKTKDSTLDWIDPANTTVGGVFKFDLTTPPDLGTYLYNAFTFDANTSTTAQKMAPLTIANDPSYAMVRGGVRLLDPSIQFFALEHFTLAFYNGEGVKQFSRDYSSYTHSGQPSIEIGAVTPGSYKILFIPQASMLQPQWYPNATSIAGAAPVTFTAGGTVDNIYFFAQSQPAGAVITISTASQNFATPAAATGSVTVNATAGAVWAAVSNVSWITVTSGFTGSGNGTVGFAIAANTAADQRTGSITIGGQTFTVTQPGTSTVLKGDINGDGNVNLADAILALQVNAGMAPSVIRSGYAASGADVNTDGKIDLPELLYILQYVAGLRQ